VLRPEARQDVLHQLPVPVLLACDVELSGTPEQLAQALAARCQSESVSIN